MKEDDFRDIGPFEGQDFEDAMSRLMQYPQLLNNFTDILSRHNRVVNKWKSFHAKRMLSMLLGQVHNYMDFQEFITCGVFLDMIESSSIEKFTYDGIYQLQPWTLGSMMALAGGRFSPAMWWSVTRTSRPWLWA